MWNSLWLSALFGIIFIAVLQFFPLKVVPFSVVIGGIFFIILGLLTIMYKIYYVVFLQDLSYLE